MSQRSVPFLWGAATSAHQVEGNNIHNDWWDWERRTAGIERSGKACDHFNRYAEDFALAKTLGHNAHRLSLEWSRLEVESGEWNHKAIQHYRQVLEELKKNGLSSFVTLNHFTLPKWVAERGGWLDRDTSRLFARYASMVAQQLGDLVDFWVTINEPIVYAYKSYWAKQWPPRQHSAWSVLKVLDNMASAHRRAYEVIHLKDPNAKVGIAHNAVAYLPHNPKFWGDQAAVRVIDWWVNQRFYKKTKGTHDFIGMNYYFTHEIKMTLWPLKVASVPGQGEKSDLGWEIHPEGLTHKLLQFKKYHLPIYITENGLADADDSRRAQFIRSHIRAIEKAQSQGVDVRGYLHWSLLDNFEWANGFSSRFGLVAVDYKTMERVPRPSAYVLKAIIKQSS